MGEVVVLAVPGLKCGREKKKIAAGEYTDR